MKMGPKVECPSAECGGASIKLGAVSVGVLIFVITSALAALSTAVLIPYRVAKAEEKQEVLERNQKTLFGNLIVLDEQARLNAQTAKHTSLKVDALLENAGIAERIDAPAVPESKLKPLE